MTSRPRRARPVRSGATIRPRAPGANPPQRVPFQRWRRLRIGAFIGLVVLVGGAAIALVVDRLQGPVASDESALQVRASMAGFDPSELTVTAGQTVRIEFASLDTPFHSDGGGWHEFAIDALGIDWKVGPESSRVFELTAPAEPGTYEWYCDICCGGKENPTMRGTLRVIG